MLYLITQFDVEGHDPATVMENGSQLNKKLLEEGCRLIMQSDQLEFSIFSLPEGIEEEIKKICEAFGKYCAEIVHVDFQFDMFTWKIIEESGNFPLEFVEAIRLAEGRASH